MTQMDVRRRSPLAAEAPVEAADGSYRAEELALLAKYVVRAEPGVAEGPLGTLTGADLPTPTTAVEGKDIRVLWLGPDEFLVVGAPGTDESLKTSLEKGLEGTHHQIADVSDYYTTISVTGSFARDALARLSTLDLHPRSLKTGAAISSMFAKAQAVMHVREGDRGETFDLYVRWSMASYLWALLLEAARVKGVKAPAKMAVKWSINPEH